MGPLTTSNSRIGAVINNASICSFVFESSIILEILPMCKPTRIMGADLGGRGDTYVPPHIFKGVGTPTFRPQHTGVPIIHDSRARAVI